MGQAALLVADDGPIGAQDELATLIGNPVGTAGKTQVVFHPFPFHIQERIGVVDLALNGDGGRHPGHHKAIAVLQ